MMSAANVLAPSRPRLVSVALAVCLLAFTADLRAQVTTNGEPRCFSECDTFAKRLLYSEYIFVPSSVAADAVVFLIEDIDVNEVYSRDQWRSTFSAPPAFDEDHWSWNYLVHPVMGSFSYLAFRNRGGHWAEALCAAALNSVIYEYLIAGATQQPSGNDMLATPLLGGLLGEGIYRLKKHMLRDRRLNAWEKVVVGVTDPFELLHYGFNFRRMARAEYR